MRRFFIAPGAIRDGIATVEGDLWRHMFKVLRLKAGAPVILADGKGREYAGVISVVEADRADIRINETLPGTAVSAGPAITLLQGVPKGERMELILQKGTELGAHGFAPFLSSRTIPRLSSDRAAERVSRWERIIAEAARQSRSPHIPTIATPVPLTEALQNVRQEVRLLLWEGENQRGLKAVIESLPCPASVALLIGPEGGLSPEEASEAAAAGFIPVTLGKRILRTETAGLAAVSILQYVWGDVG